MGRAGQVFGALAPGGVVFIDVPNECSLWSRLGNLYMRVRRRDWAVNLSPSFPPYHVVGFCPHSLRWLLNGLGYEVVDLRTHRWPNALPETPALLGQIERRAAEATLSVGAWLGSGSGITAWARRPKDKGVAPVCRPGPRPGRASDTLIAWGGKPS
jgi:hypothetical protein